MLPEMSVVNSGSGTISSRTKGTKQVKIYNEHPYPRSLNLERTDNTVIPAGWGGGQISIEQIAKAKPNYPAQTRTTEEPR
jgi:hypothetical protein